MSRTKICLAALAAVSMCAVFAADGGKTTSLAEARGGIGDAISNPAAMESAMNSLSAADQVAISIAKLMAGEPDLDNPAKDGPQEQFFGDLHRGPLNNEPFLLPDGPLPANDDGTARDRIVRFLSGRADATWAGADPGLKRKAVVLMACCNQSLGGIALSSIGEAFDPAHASPLGIGFMPANPTGRQPLPRESSYRVSMDPDGSVRIRYLWKQPVMAVLP